MRLKGSISAKALDALVTANKGKFKSIESTNSLIDVEIETDDPTLQATLTAQGFT